MRDRDLQMYLNFEQHRVADRFFDRMDPEVSKTFTPAQQTAIKRTLVRAFLSPSPKILDIRWVFSCLRRRFFLVFLFGREIREGDPRYFGRFLSRSRWLFNMLFLLLVVLVLFCALLGLRQVVAWLLA